MGSNDLSDASLVLGLGFSVSSGDHKSKTAPTAGQNLSLTLSLSGETYDHEINHASKKVNCPDNNNNNNNNNNQLSADLYRQDSAASSFSNVSVKRERELGSEEAEIERFPSRISDEDDEYSNGRKKLTLNKAQSALLEESFKIHSTLNPKQKQELARELKLRPRQVEVWFQNRRARTKLKQTEIDCEFLKKCCESLTDENRRLQKEVDELKALKSAQPMYMQLPAATLTMCPSCERIGGGAPDNSAKSSFTKPQFYNPFTKPSAAC